MRFLWAAVVLGALSGCGPAAAFQCDNDLDCLRGNRPQGTCEPVGYCSFPDSGCPSGQRYGEGSAGFGGKCVPETPGSGGTSTGSGGGTDSSSGSSSSGSGGGSATSDTATTLEPTTGISGSGTGDTGLVMSTGESSSTGPGFDAELVLWLDFEAGEADKSSYNHAVSCSATCPDATTGMFGSGALFDDDYLEVASHPALDFSDRFTFTAWVRPDGLSNLARGTIVSQEYAPGAMSYDVSVQDFNANPTLDLVTASEGGGPGIPDLFETGDWVFLAIRFENGQQQVFVDGAEVYLGMIAVPSSQQAPVFIGGVPGIGFPFIGAIDDVRLYRRVLSDVDLAAVAAGDPVD